MLSSYYVKIRAGAKVTSLIVWVWRVRRCARVFAVETDLADATRGIGRRLLVVDIRKLPASPSFFAGYRVDSLDSLAFFASPDRC